MKKAAATSSNFAPLKIILPMVLIALISAGGIALWPVYILFLLIVLFVYHGIFLAPAGAFVKYRFNDGQIEITNVIRKASKVYSMEDDVYLYIYPAFAPHLLISDKPLNSKKEAKKSIRSGETGCVTLWGEFRATLDSYEKKAVKLK